MKKAKLILGAALLAGVAYAASQNFTVIVNGQVSDLQGVVVNNRLYVPADVLPDLGIRISAAPGVLSLSSDAGGGSRGSVSVTTPSTVVTGGTDFSSSNRNLGTAFEAKGGIKLTVNSCVYSGKPSSNLECYFTLVNVAGKDNSIRFDTDNWGIVLSDGNKYKAVNFEIDSQKISGSYVNIFDSFTKQGKVVFTIPSRFSEIAFFDISSYVNYGSSIEIRFRNVPIY